MTRNILYLLIAIVVLSCEKHEVQQSEFELDRTDIYAQIFKINLKSDVDDIFLLGLYNLAFEAIIQNNFQDSAKVEFAYKLVENGEYDKGIYLIKSVDHDVFRFEIIHLQLLCELGKQLGSKPFLLLDSLLKVPIIPSDKKKQLDLMMVKAYLEHNQKNFREAINLNLQAIDFLEEHKVTGQQLAMIFHRLGNSYNDIVRDKMPFDKSYDFCYEQGIAYYNKELNLLLKESPTNKNRIALCYITMAMLNNAYNAGANNASYYKKALNELIVYQDSTSLFTSHAVYTSIALSQFAEHYAKEGFAKLSDSLLSLNEKLVSTRSFYRIDNNQSLDIWEYFSQRSEELKMIQLKQLHTDSTALQLLNLGINCKYANLNLHKLLHKEFSTQIDVALKNWVLIKELILYANITENISHFNKMEDLLLKYQTSINNILKQKKRSIQQKDLEALKALCRVNNACIIDYQVLYSRRMLISIIDEDKLELRWVKKDEGVTSEMVDKLLKSIKTNDIQQFQSISSELIKLLSLDHVKGKNLIISPDEFLEKIPFDALILEETPGENRWAKQNFLANSHKIHLVPNLAVLLDNWSDENPLFIDIWTSNLDNQSLPYNQKLINFINKNFAATSNSKSPQNILHIMAHTHKSSKGEIEFRLNSDTLYTRSIKWVSPKLAILAGCSSGDGDYFKMEGSISQTRNFLYHGTPTVIYSTWDADNHATSELFKAFYSHLDKGFAVSEALAKAKHEIRSNKRFPEWSNPFYWANFQVIGKEQLFY